MIDKRKLAFPLFFIYITAGFLLLADVNHRLFHYIGIVIICFPYSILSLTLPGERKRDLSFMETLLLCISLLMALLVVVASTCIHHLLDVSYAVSLALLAPLWLCILLPAYFLCRLLRNAPPFVSDKTPRTQLATRTAMIVFLVYVGLYYILSLFGSYVLPGSEKSEAVTHPTYQWQPKFIVNYKDYNEDKIITKANLLGQLYAPLLFIDQRYVHQSNVTTNSWVRWLGDTFIFGFKYGFIDKTGELVIPFQYDETHGFSEDMAPVQIEGNWGYIDRKGLMVIEPQFDYAQNFSEALAAVRDEDGKYGYIDKSGVYVIDPQFENANNFIDGLATVKDISGKYGQIDKTGQYVVEPKYDNSSYLSKALICNKLGDKFGFVNKNEELAIEHQYTYAQDFSEGLALVSKDCNGLDFRIFPNEPLSAGFIDTHGQVIINFQYDNAYSFSEGMAGIKTGGKWGFIDKSGEIVITPQFSMIRSFSEELAVVSIDHKQGYIDKSGKIAIEPQFDIASDFSEGLAPVAVKMTDGKSDKD